jgi:hypothetical protein
LLRSEDEGAGIGGNVAGSEIQKRGARRRPAVTLLREAGTSLALAASIPIVAGAEFPRLSLCLVFGQAVTLLQFACQDFPVTFHLVDLIVSELSPLLFDLALQLPEITLDRVLVHARPSV